MRTLSFPLHSNLLEGHHLACGPIPGLICSKSADFSKDLRHKTLPRLQQEDSRGDLTDDAICALANPADLLIITHGVPDRQAGHVMAAVKAVV